MRAEILASGNKLSAEQCLQSTRVNHPLINCVEKVILCM